MLTALFLIVLALCALCMLPVLIALTLRVLPLFIGLLCCWALFQACF